MFSGPGGVAAGSFSNGHPRDCWTAGKTLRPELLLRSCAGLHAVQMDRRVALVVGCDNYERMPKTQGTLQDAQAMQLSLDECGFEVAPKKNLEYGAFRQTLVDFKRLLQHPPVADLAVFFFSGHGLTQRGRHYLAAKNSVDCDDCICVEDDVIPAMASAKHALLLLNCCRVTEDGIDDGGFMEDIAIRTLNPSSSVFVQYACMPRAKARDGSTKIHSPFMGALTRHLFDPSHVDLLAALSAVIAETIQATNGSQHPMQSTNDAGAFSKLKLAPGGVGGSSSRRGNACMQHVATKFGIAQDTIEAAEWLRGRYTGGRGCTLIIDNRTSKWMLGPPDNGAPRHEDRMEVYFKPQDKYRVGKDVKAFGQPADCNLAAIKPGASSSWAARAVGTLAGTIGYVRFPLLEKQGNSNEFKPVQDSLFVMWNEPGPTGKVIKWIADLCFDGTTYPSWAAAVMSSNTDPKVALDKLWDGQQRIERKAMFELAQFNYGELHFGGTVVELAEPTMSTADQLVYLRVTDHEHSGTSTSH